MAIAVADVEQKRISLEAFFRIEERVEVKLEYVEGLVVPKEGSEPLPDWVVEKLLQPELDEDTLNYEFPMASKEHFRLISLLHKYLILASADKPIEIQSQSPFIRVSLSGKYRIPDLTVLPEAAEQAYEGDFLLNPIAIFEVLSDSTASKDHNEKRREYFSIESLQEYFLVSQNERLIERYRRLGEGKWELTAFTEGELLVSSVGVSLKLGDIYDEEVRG